MRIPANQPARNGADTATSRAKSPLSPASTFQRAFTLLEVMIASGIFFMATFAILALVAQSLRNARALERNEANAGMAAAMVYDIVKTNRMDEGAGNGDFGNLYPEYSYDYEWHPYQTNGLLEVDLVLNRRGNKLPADSLVFLVFNPNTQIRR